MKNRETPLPHKDSPVFIRVELPDREDHVFKTPSMLVGMKLFQVLDQSALMAFAAATQQAGPGTMFALMRQAGPEVIQALGYLLGVSWHHPHKELETKESDYPDALAYGEAVFEELHSEDYDLNQIVMMALAIVKNWIDRNTVAEEAVQKLGFFPATKVAST